MKQARVCTRVCKWGKGCHWGPRKCHFVHLSVDASLIGATLVVRPPKQPKQQAGASDGSESKRRSMLLGSGSAPEANRTGVVVSVDPVRQTMLLRNVATSQRPAFASTAPASSDPDDLTRAFPHAGFDAKEDGEHNAGAENDIDISLAGGDISLAPPCDSSSSDALFTATLKTVIVVAKPRLILPQYAMFE